MKRTRLLLAAALVGSALLSTAAQPPAPPRLVAPAEGTVVPLLNERQRTFLSMPHEERIAAYSNEAFRAELRKTAGDRPKPVRLEWDGGDATNGARTVFTVEVRRRPDGTPVFRADTVGTSVEVDNLEIAREYEWTVHANAFGHAAATGTFRTEDRAPRLIDGGAVPNVRDLGGRIGLGGRRVRQGLVYRSAGLNSNAQTRYLTREEAFARSADPDALAAAEAALVAETNALAALQARPGDLPLVAGTLPRTWTVFRVSKEAFDAEGDAALRALREIPATFLGAPAEEADLGEDADFTFPAEARDAAAGPAVFLCEADFSDDGWCGFGCGADWFWSLRIDDANRSLWLDTLGIRTDIDLRSEGEVRGMEGSPLGPTVAWVNVSSSAYGGMQDEGGRKAFAKVFRVFLDPQNYPIDFHCIAGQDRTGAVAFILNALLGVEEEQLYLDWEATAFWNPSPHVNHEKLFFKLVRGFDRWPGDTINERVEAYVLDLGFTPGEIGAFREIMLEPAQ